MNPMETAPQDGQRILIKRMTYAFTTRRNWQPRGTQIVECWWHRDKWQLWCGNAETTSTDWIDPLGWWPKPQ